MKTRIILADDHGVFREALRALIEVRMPEVQIVGEAATGTQALALCREHCPDLLVLDVSMPELGGFEVLADLPAVSPRTRVVIVSQYSDRAYVLRALRAGAHGYLPKKALGQDLITAIHTVLSGQTYLDPSVAEVVVDAAIHPHESQPWGELAPLTAREREVMVLVAEGKTNKEVGRLLSISPHTVNRHRANLMEKLGVRSRAELVRKAIKFGLIDA